MWLQTRSELRLARESWNIKSGSTLKTHALKRLSRELRWLEQTLCRRVTAFSKHASGRMRLGLHHHPPYEPEWYFPWANDAGLKHFFGNLENPKLESQQNGELLSFPGAFWLEPSRRDVSRDPIKGLLREASERSGYAHASG
jgi:hypothetical protein